MSGLNGLIFYSTPTYTVSLVVRDGIVVGAPPFARRWALGHDAHQVVLDGVRRNADLAWLPQDDVMRIDP